MIDLKPHAEGVILPVRAQPGSRRNEIRGEQNGFLKVCVTQSPEKGKANKAIAALLSSWGKRSPAFSKRLTRTYWPPVCGRRRGT